VAISEMTVIVVLLCSKDSSLDWNADFRLRNFPPKDAATFINEPRSILSHIHLLQSSIDHLLMQQPLEEQISPDRGLHEVDPGLATCYRSFIGDAIFFEVHLRAYLGILFQIHLHPGKYWCGHQSLFRFSRI
jgi:hypothetical protein